MAETYIYFALCDKTGQYEGTPAKNTACNGYIIYYGTKFAAYNSSFVSQTVSSLSETIDLWNTTSLFYPPSGFYAPATGSSYYIYNLDKDVWLGNGSLFSADGFTLAAEASAGRFSIGDALQCYPNWIGTYTISYNANYSGGSSPASQTAIVGTYVTMAAALSRTGYTFREWNSKADSSGYGYSAGTSVTRSEPGSVTVYAVWDAITYSVAFNANGGSGAPASQTKAYGVNLLLSTTKPARTGYTFVSWNTSANGTGTSYSPGGYYTANTSATLYAIWKADTYVVSYNANGGSGIPASQTKTYGVTLTLSSTKPVRTGYTFTGWNTSADGSGTSYAAGGSYTANAAATLYAQWSQITYTVSYNANGGTGAPASQTKGYGVAIALSSGTPSRSGYVFLRWNTKADGTGTRYLPGASYSVNASVTLYAEWQPGTYTISYNANGGSGAPSSQSKTHGKSITLSSVKPTRAGYSFSTWNTKADGTGTSYSPGGSYSADSAVTLYAVWKANPTVTVAFNANGGTGAPASQSGLQGTSITLSSSKPSRSSEAATYLVTYDKVQEDAQVSKESDSVMVVTNYAFSHWNTSPDGKGASYSPGGSLQLSSGITLYAIYSVTQSGSATLPDGTLEQYVLKGWSTSDNGKSIVDSPYIPSSDITLYAVWVPDGLGGMIKFEGDSVPDCFSVGSVVRLSGVGDPSNDRLYTVAKSEASDGTVTVVFEEDFQSSGEQDAQIDPLSIYGEGTFVPDMDYICSLNNRLWGCSSARRTIYGSALGDPTDFWTFAGNSLDAYQVGVGSAGGFTGCVAMNSSILFFKQHTLHKLLGNYPAEYAVYTYEMDGISEGNFRSAKNCDGAAVYVTEHGIGTYSGADGGILSKELGEGGMNASLAGYDGEKYFLAFSGDDGRAHSYVYDTRYGLWLEDDHGGVMDYAHLGEDDYILVEDGEKNAVYRLTTGEADPDIGWHMTFKPYIETISSSRRRATHVFEKKRYTGITLRLELPEGSWIKAELKADEGQWMPVARLSGSSRHGVRDFRISTPRVDKVQLRLSGHGSMTILSMEREYLIGSRR